MTIAYLINAQKVFDTDGLPYRCHNELDVSNSFCPTCGTVNTVRDAVVPLLPGFYSPSGDNVKVTTKPPSRDYNRGLPLYKKWWFRPPIDLKFGAWPCRAYNTTDMEIMLSLESVTGTVYNDLRQQLKAELEKHNIEWDEDRICV